MKNEGAILRAGGLDKLFRTNFSDKSRTAQALDLVDAGMSAYKAARLIKISPTTIYKAMKRARIAKAKQAVEAR